MRSTKTRPELQAWGVVLVLAAAWPLLEEIGQRIWSVLG